MCSASALLVAGGGSGGNSPEGGVLLQLSGGGGAGGVVLLKDTSFGDGYYLVSVGEGGVNDPAGTRGIGGDSTLELKQRLSLTSTEYPGQEIRAFGGGRGGGVFLIPGGKFVQTERKCVFGFSWLIPPSLHFLLLMFLQRACSLARFLCQAAPGMSNSYYCTLFLPESSSSFHPTVHKGWRYAFYPF